MAINLSNVTFTQQDDIVPSAGVERILNTGVTNTFAGNDIITGTQVLYEPYPADRNGIFNGYGSTLNTGEGNDIITGTGALDGIQNSSGTLNTGEGNDIITGTGGDHGIQNHVGGEINTDDGNDTITGTGIVDAYSGIINRGNLNTGNGNDVITATSERDGFVNSGGRVNTGDGNDTITGTGGFNSNSITYGIIIDYTSYTDTGNGDDVVTGTGKGGIFTAFGTLNTGDGNDIITGIGETDISGIGRIGIFTHLGGTINTGNGQDSIISHGVFMNNIYGYEEIGGGGVFLGEGNDIIASSDIIYNGRTIDTGSGEDSITSQGTLKNYGGVFLGEGNDSILTDVEVPNRALENFGFIGTGDGNDTITSTGVLYNQGVIETGNGDDSIIVDGGIDDITGNTYSIYNNGGAINMGGGNDSIIANEGFESAPNSSGAYFLGEGEDYIKGYGSGDFYGGNGNDTLELTPGTYTVGIWGEGPDKSVIFTKGNQIMITSEFEFLIDVATGYNLANLTDGQIIVVG